jgi:hypothetical protein
MDKYRNASTMDGCMTTMSRPYFAFVLMGQYQLLFYVPWSVHDSQVTELGKIYQKLEQVHKTMGGKCCVNSAFGNLKRDYLLKLGQDLLGSSAPTHHEQNLEHQLRHQTTLAWQTAEWGMLRIQASFPQVKDQFIYKE